VSYKAFGVCGERALEDVSAFDLHALGATKMDRRWRVETQPRMAVHVVVPAEEAPAEGAAIFDRAEAVGGRQVKATLELRVSTRRWSNPTVVVTSNAAVAGTASGQTAAHGARSSSLTHPASHNDLTA
jgi:hypothetical protein